MEDGFDREAGGTKDEGRLSPVHGVKGRAGG